MADHILNKSRLFIFTFLLFSLTIAGSAFSAQVLGPNVKVREGNIVVSTGLQLNPNHIEEIKKGVPKEINFYIDLFQSWDNWPDEFVLGTTITRTLKCDPVKNEFIGTSLSPTHHEERRFKSCESLISWALTIPEVWLTNINELAPGEYFVHIKAESRLRRLPPFINLLFFFVREVEFTVEEDSPHFPMNFKD